MLTKQQIVNRIADILRLIQDESESLSQDLIYNSAEEAIGLLEQLDLTGPDDTSKVVAIDVRDLSPIEAQKLIEESGFLYDVRKKL